MGDENLISVAEAVRRWGKSERTIYRWISEGKITAYKENGSTLVQPDRPQSVRVQKVVTGELSTMPDRPGECLSDVGTPNKALIEIMRSDKKQIFRLHVMLLVAVLTAGVLGGAYYIDQRSDRQRMAEHQRTLAAVRQQVVTEQGRGDRLEGALQSQQDQHSEALAAERAEHRRIVEQVVKDLSQKQPEPAPWWKKWLSR